MIAVDLVNKLLNKFGAELTRFPNRDLAGRMNLLRHHRINKILDIGANDGGFVRELRLAGYTNKVISFEPLNEVFLKLSSYSKSDMNWTCENFAIGNFDGKSEINIAGNLNSSSILEMLPSHAESAPESVYIGKQSIIVKKLDTIFKDYHEVTDNVFLKIDTQGFEKQILEGATESLRNIKGIQVEMSLIPLYKDSFLYNEMIDFLQKKGFVLCSIEPGFRDRTTGRLLQFDGVFFKI